jgi:hypothetical protein
MRFRVRTHTFNWQPGGAVWFADPIPQMFPLTTEKHPLPGCFWLEVLLYKWSLAVAQARCSRTGQTDVLTANAYWHPGNENQEAEAVNL